jgi:hypothetical protein
VVYDEIEMIGAGTSIQATIDTGRSKAKLAVKGPG